MAKSAAHITPNATEHLKRIAVAHGEMVAVRDIAEVVESMMTSLRGELDSATSRIGGELKDMIDFIDNAKKEISEISPSALAKNDIPGAADHLDAVIEHTEQAAGQIMDCADEITTIASEVDGELSERLHAIATRIFEASSFQDITGQRVTKVVRVLKTLEERLAKLADIADDKSHTYEKKTEYDAQGVALDHKDLLNGPQLPANANNQDDIDALLASFD